MGKQHFKGVLVMAYKLLDKYYIITEDIHIGFYNLLEAKYEILLKLDNKRAMNILSALNQPFEISDFHETEQLLIKDFLKRYGMYFKEISYKEFEEERIKHQYIDQFIETNYKAFDLKIQGIKALLKETISFTTYWFITDTDINHFDMLSRYNIQKVDYCSLNFKHIDWYNTTFIVDSQSLTNEQISDFEKYCLTHNAIRMYVKEDKESIVIGPTLIGKEFGCLLCDEQSAVHLNNDQVAGKSIFSALMETLILTEILKVGRKIVSALIDDNTITKGKYMKLSKYNIEADEYEIKSNVTCMLCDRILNKNEMSLT